MSTFVPKDLVEIYTFSKKIAKVMINTSQYFTTFRPEIFWTMFGKTQIEIDTSYIPSFDTKDGVIEFEKRLSDAVANLEPTEPSQKFIKAVGINVYMLYCYLDPAIKYRQVQRGFVENCERSIHIVIIPSQLSRDNTRKLKGRVVSGKIFISTLMAVNLKIAQDIWYNPASNYLRLASLRDDAWGYQINTGIFPQEHANDMAEVSLRILEVLDY